MTNAFEYGDSLLAAPVSEDGAEGTDAPPPVIASNQPYLNLAT